MGTSTYIHTYNSCTNWLGAYAEQSPRHMIFHFRFSFQTLSIACTQRHISGTQKFYWFCCLVSDVCCVCAEHSSRSAYPKPNTNYLLSSVQVRCGQTELRISVWNWKSGPFRSSHAHSFSFSFLSSYLWGSESVQVHWPIQYLLFTQWLLTNSSSFSWTQMPLYVDHRSI